MHSRVFNRAILLATLVWASSQVLWAAPPKFVTAVEGIAEFQLDNGVKVLLFPDPSKPQVTVNMTVFVGSRHEGYGEAGMAHLLEHMLFKGTPDHPNVPKVLKDHGAVMNGTTWLDRTNYFETLPANPGNLEFAIKLEADRLMNSFVRKEDLDSEMTVVRNEFERGENSPSRVLSQRMMAAAYEWHNYGKTTIGNRADIERVPIDNLKRFYKKYYQPDNVMLIVAGQFNPQRALQLAQKYFGSIPKPERKLDNTYTEEPAQDGERQVVLRRVGDVSLAGSLYHIPSGPHPDFVPLDVLEHVMTNAPSGRLYNALVKTKKAARVSGGAFALHDPGVLRFSAEVTPGEDAREVLQIMVDEIEKVAEEGVSEEEVERSKSYWLKEWELAVADSAQVAIQLSEWAAQGDWRLMFIYRDRLEQANPEAVQAAAKKYLTSNNRTVGLFLPTSKAQRATIPATPNLAEMIGEYKGRKAIAQGEAFDVSPDNIEERTDRGELAGGLKLALLPKKTRGQTVDIQVTLRYGDSESLKGRATAVEVLPSLMLRGSKNLTRQQLRDALDKHRARLGGGGGAGTASFSIQTRRDSLPAVLDILRQVLREPNLAASELELMRNARLARLEQQLSDPTALAQVEVRRKTSPYDSDHVRYVPTIKEEIQRWQSVTAADVSEVYNDFLNGSHGEIAVVGDFDPQEVTKQLQAVFGGWKSSKPYKRIPLNGNVKLKKERQQINTPDKENAIYFAATVVPLRNDDKDYAALMIGNYILGSGGLSSRLGDRVRQKEGLSYGVGSFLNASSLDKRSAISIYAITNPANIKKVEKAISEEIALLIEKGVSAEELAAAKKGYLERQILSRSDDGQLAAVIGGTSFTGRTMKYYKDLEAQVGKLTVDQVNAAVRKYLDPKKITLVVAGDFEKKADGGE